MARVRSCPGRLARPRAGPNAPGRLTGTVTEVATTQPLPGIKVTLYDCWQTYHVECWDVAETVTDAAGQYTFDNPPGAWDLTLIDPADVYLFEDVPDVPLPGPDETVTLNLTMQRGEAISGKVTLKGDRRAYGRT